jgi:short subunit dehydrogenase-like uncharacterized protein
MSKPHYDLVVYGATGFTGRLVAEYLLKTYGAHHTVRWAMAGRSASKLAEVRSAIGAPDTLPLLQADASDAKALRVLAAQTQAVITTVGPYQLYGQALLQACVETGTDYTDLCGEPNWMARMIDRFDAPARASGARIVFSCGFDSVPFDLGVRFLQNAAIQQFKRPLQHIKGHVVRMSGTFSGGTAASLLATLDAVSQDKSVAALMANPFALTPGFSGPAQPDNSAAQFEADAGAGAGEGEGAWSAPFVMAAINTKNVHRSNQLLHHLYGQDFVYEERQLWGSGSAGEMRARGAARTKTLQTMALGFGPTRALIRRFVVPKPGEGPGPKERERGFYTVRVSGQTAQGERLAATVHGDRDPGYGSTSKLISECALCLVQDLPRSSTAGGLWTPGAALGMAVVPRLQERAGLSFSLEA